MCVVKVHLHMESVVEIQGGSWCLGVSLFLDKLRCNYTDECNVTLDNAPLTTMFAGEKKSVCSEVDCTSSRQIPVYLYQP